jgi:hypothetical protein
MIFKNVQKTLILLAFVQKLLRQPQRYPRGNQKSEIEDGQKIHWPEEKDR